MQQRRKAGTGDNDDGSGATELPRSAGAGAGTEGGSKEMGYPVWALVVGSIFSSVALVVVNKQILAAGFPYVFTLSTMHFIVTSGLLQFMARVVGAFEVRILSAVLVLLEFAWPPKVSSWSGFLYILVLLLRFTPS